MKKLFFILSVFTLILSSCDSDNQTVIQPIVNKLELTVDGKTYTSINENVGGNENCNAIYVSTFYYKANDIQMRLNFSISKSGQLLQATYQEYDLTIQTSQSAKLFLTKNFNPKATFSINDFQYNEIQNTVKFDFQGTVFLENQNTTTRTLSGSIEVNDFKAIPCTAETNAIQYNTEELQFNAYNPSRTKFFSATQEHRFFSNNGYMISVVVADDFWNLPVGNYLFNEDTTMNKVFFRTFNASLVANQTPIYNIIQWKSFESRGSFSIQNKSIENGFKKITGQVNMEVLFENEVVFTINSMNYSTGSFEE